MGNIVNNVEITGCEAKVGVWAAGGPLYRMGGFLATLL